MRGRKLSVTSSPRIQLLSRCAKACSSSGSCNQRCTMNSNKSPSPKSCENLNNASAPKRSATYGSGLVEDRAVERRRTIVGNCYDYPQYYDVAPPAYTRREADFIEAACDKYCLFDVHRLLEPACGGGRLITELTARGYEVIGFDVSQPALTYLRRG